MATASDRLRRAKPLLGTFVEIAAAHAAPDLMEAAAEDAFDAIARVHRCMSFHDPASDVPRLNQHAVSGAEPEAVFTRHPPDPHQHACHVQRANEALASSGYCLDLCEPSGAARRAIIDPRTQKPPDAIAGVSVRASSCLMADALPKVV